MPENVLHRIEEEGFAPRTATHAEIHDVYGMENSRATFDGLKALDKDTRPFVLTRATYAGGQRYAATWSGDNSSSWNHLRLATPMLENLGLSGFAFCGADVGGYAGSPTPELLTKWLEVAAFQPIYRDHAEKGKGDQEPWAGGSEQEAIRRRFIEARYQLMPYLYTLADESSRTGLPMVRPLFLEYPNAAPDGHPMDIDLAASGEFMLGSDLLIAPAPYPEENAPYVVEFPSSDWYDFWTGKKVPLPLISNPPVADPGTVPGRDHQFSIQATPELSQLPVFIRAGSILPLSPVVQSTSETPQGPLTLRVYPGDRCSGELYQDDGISNAFQHGVYLRMSFSCQKTARGVLLNIGPHVGSHPAWWKEIRVEIFGLTPGNGEVLVNGTKVSADADADHQLITFVLEDGGKGEAIEVK
jgi:alpha-glucosidase